jgi:DNA-directed RNA polymerase specialized sigma24 family protein
MMEDRAPARRKFMRKIKEVPKLRFELELGQRQIARRCGMGLGTVHEYLERAVATYGRAARASRQVRLETRRLGGAASA